MYSIVKVVFTCIAVFFTYSAVFICWKVKDLLHIRGKSRFLCYIFICVLNFKMQSPSCIYVFMCYTYVFSFFNFEEYYMYWFLVFTVVCYLSNIMNIHRMIKSGNLVGLILEE